jgi:TonB family protein
MKMLPGCALVLLLAPLAFPQAASGSKVIPPRVARHGTTPLDYSEEARLNHIGGIVKLKVTVDTEGHVKDIEVVRAVGYGLDENAVKAVRTWKFEPATQNGKPMEGAISIDCEFRAP